MKTIASFTLASLLLVGGAAQAASHAESPKAGAPAGQAAAADMATGEVRKVDTGTKKITLRHSPIKNLDMPSMTMVFQVQDPAMLDKVKVGDQVRFTAEKINGAITLTHIDTAKPGTAK